MHIYIYVCIHTCMYVFRKRYAVQMVLLYKSAAVFPLLVIYFNFGSNGLPLFSVFSKREKDLNIHYIGGIIPLFHTCGGKLFWFNNGEVGIERVWKSGVIKGARVIKANKEFRGSRMTKNVTEVFDARIQNANRRRNARRKDWICEWE